LKNGTASESLRLSFVTDSEKNWTDTQSAPWTPARSKTLALAPHSDFTEYTFDMSGVRFWKGFITALRLDLLEAKEGMYQIDWIRIGSGAEHTAPPVMVDARATFAGGKSFTGPEELKTILKTDRKNDFVRSFTEHLLTYALGRKVEDEDAPAVGRITRAAAQENYRLSTIVREIVMSDLFRYRRSTEAKHE
jgi:hypothetical protein